ncbi:MAG: biotin/lipoyl-binding protein, partial [Flavobacteriales bacterium]
MNLTSHLPRVMAALALVVGMTQCGGPAAPAEEAASAPTARLTRVGVRTMEWAPFAHSFAVQGNVETDRVANILAEFPGVVDAVLVEEGTQVAKGEAILRINT